MSTEITLLHNAVVLTMNEEFHLFNPGAVAVSGDSILAVGTDKDLLEAYPHAEKMDCQGKILMPGLVNAHTHVPMTLLRGLEDDLRLDVWLLGYMIPVEREFVSSEFVRLGTKLACAEMIRSGITSFADMYYFEDDIAEATVECGMRAVCTESILKFSTPDANSYEESIAYTRRFIEKWKGHSLIVPGIAPHAVYSTTDEILSQCGDIAREYDVPLHIHVSETIQEVENHREKEGMPVVPYIKKLGVLDAKVIAAHCVHLDLGEIRTLQHYNTGVAHNPSSNLKLASGIAPVVSMLDSGLNVGIGTDGPASNNDLDMFEELRLASFIAKGSSGNPTVLPATQTLEMATIMGAKVLHLDDITGSIEVGKRADLILVDVSPVHNSPTFKRNPLGAYAQIVYASKATDVTDVMVNGQWLMRDKHLLTINEPELLEEAKGYAGQIDAFLAKREKSLLLKLLALGEPISSEESYEIQAKVPIEDIKAVENRLNDPQIEILYHRKYHQYDAYMLFDDEDQVRLRHREDDLIGKNGKPVSVRSRLTLIKSHREFEYPSQILLSRSRYLATATQSLRFYREYFKPVSEIEVEKMRERYKIRFEDTEFFINLDTLVKPSQGKYLEVKSNTWSQRDAETKSAQTAKLIRLLGQDPDHAIRDDYLDLITRPESNHGG